MSKSLRLVSPFDEEVHAMISQMDRSQIALYGLGIRHADPPELLSKGNVFLLGIFKDGILAGIGAIKLMEGYAEIKRIYVVENVRGTGMAQRLLKGLERYAAALGYDNICLEAGNRHYATLRFYEKSGYKRTSAFGEYKTNSVSVYMQKVENRDVCSHLSTPPG